MSLHDDHLALVLNEFSRILKDQTMQHLHTLTIQAITTSFKTLGSNITPYCNRVCWFFAVALSPNWDM